MKLRTSLALLASAFISLTAAASAADRARAVQPLDAEWLFARGEASTAFEPMFDDANWRTLDVPHDWAIEGIPEKDAAVGRGGGYRASGVSWYRKRFSLPATAAARRVFVEFDGVMANAEAWINGHRLGLRPSGYVSFAHELTGFIEFGDDKSNTLAVRTDTTAQPASRWYTGQGSTATCGSSRPTPCASPRGASTSPRRRSPPTAPPSTRASPWKTAV
jgi:beta-galactosidase